MDTVKTLENPLMKGLGPSILRAPERPDGIELPQDMKIISADDHWEVGEDIFYENFPAHLKEKAPRVWFDRYWHIGFQGQLEAFGTGDSVARSLERSNTTGLWDMDLRMNHMRTEGVQQEIVYPQSLLGFVRHKDLEVKEWMFRVYNEYIATLKAKSEGMCNGVGICSNWWDPKKAESAIQQIVDLGLKTYMVPITPGMTLDGKTISYGGEEMDVFWSVAAEAGIPVGFHIGENPVVDGRGTMGSTVLAVLDPFRKPLGQLIFGGVFDRHPNLKVVFAEGGISWVPPALQDAEMIFDTYGVGDLLDPIKHRPSHYWHNNCYATFMNDPLGLSQLDYIGAGRIMWAADYPHNEGTYGYNWSSMNSIVDAAGLDNARKILGGTAAQIYNLN